MDWVEYTRIVPGSGDLLSNPGL